MRLKKVERIASLDGLRAISISLVLLAHASVRLCKGSPPYGRLLEALGYLGVTIFFVISGFLITALLLKEFGRTGKIDVLSFFRRRILRILPAAVVYIVVVLIVGHPKLIQTLLALTFTTSYAFGIAYLPLQHLWSLSVEEQFYLLWPLAFATGVGSARKCCWAVIGLAPLFRLIFVQHQVLHLFPCVADSLAFGCLLALYYERLRTFTSAWMSSRSVFGSLCLTAVGLAVGLYNRKELVLAWSLVPALVALLTLVAIERSDYILNFPLIRALGLLSYSLYLWQQPFLLLPGPYDFLPLRLMMCLLAASISYFLVERPILSIFSKGKLTLADEGKMTKVNGFAACPLE